MIAVRVLCPFVILLSLTACGKPASVSQNIRVYAGPRSILGEGLVTADIMKLWGPNRYAELAGRFQQAVQDRPDWLLQLTQSVRPGEPLPYDRRMGLSAAEYAEFLKLANQLSVAKTDESTLSFTKKGEDAFVLEGGPGLEDVTGIEIDLENDVVRTPFGELTDRKDSDVSDNSAIGPWTGVRWKTDRVDADSGVGIAASFELGQLKESGRSFIHYDVRGARRDGAVRIRHILFFDPPVE